MDNEDMPGCYTGDNPWGTLRDDPTPVPSAPAEPPKVHDCKKCGCLTEGVEGDHFCNPALWDELIDAPVNVGSQRKTIAQLNKVAPVAPATEIKEFLTKTAPGPWREKANLEIPLDKARDYLTALIAPASSAARELAKEIFSYSTSNQFTTSLDVIVCRILDRIEAYASAERQRVAALERERDIYKADLSEVDKITGRLPIHSRPSSAYVSDLKTAKDAAEAKLREATELITEVANQTCGCYAIDDPNWHSSRCVTGKAQAWLRNQSKGE